MSEREKPIWAQEIVLTEEEAEVFERIMRAAPGEPINNPADTTGGHPMTWRPVREIDTPGWYWLRRDDRVQMIQVICQGNEQWYAQAGYNGGPYPTSLLPDSASFAGPLTPPEDAR